MSIAAAENAGLGPCDLPLSDPWVTHPTQTSGVCPLPLSSPAAATAAVAVSASAVALGGYHQSNTTSTASLLQQQQQLSQQHSNQQQQIPNQQQSTALSLPHLQHSPQAKIMNAVASAAACPASATNRKIRRKTDSKPQSQINKCNNEKRRRELENNFIEQLGEFLQLNKRGDMTSTKPDKAAILNQVVKTYRDLCGKGNNRDNISSSRCTRCPTNCADNCTIHPVQQGDVSSTEPPLPEPALNGQQPEISAYFEALEHYISSVGWILVQINAEGIIESCTQNIKELIGYERSELQKQPIYSYLHAGDHSKLSPILNNMSFALDGWDQDEQQHQKNRRSITTKVRMLCKRPESVSETMEQKQQRQDKYEEVVLIAAPVKDDGDESSSVLCLITRPEEESPLETNMQQHTQQRSLEQMTMKLDISGKILQIDTSALRASYGSTFSKERGRQIQDICHIQDLHTLQTHLKSVHQSSSSIVGTPIQSGPFRLRLGIPDAYVHVKANSRLFINTTPGESDYIMSVQTILNDNNITSTLPAIESSQSNNSLVSLGVNVSGGVNVGGGGIPSMPSTSHHHTSTTNVGGPLMTSVINGTVPQVHQASPRTSNSVVTSFSSPPSASESSSFFPADSFDFDFQQHSFEMDTVGWDSRPDSRTSVTTPGTPRPPSVQAYSPANPSPLTPYHTSQSAGQPSPQNINNNNNNNTNNNLNNNGGNFGFSFPNFDEKDQKDHLNNNTMSSNNNNTNGGGQNQNNNQHNHDSERLRNLLTVKRTQSSTSSGGMVSDDQDHRNTHRILKGLLNAEEEKDNAGYNKMNSGLTSRMYPARPRPSDNKTGNNLMLLQLLNEKSDDDDRESGTNRLHSELLRQLQKDDTPKEHNTTSGGGGSSSNQMGTEELKSLLRIQGNEYTRKRPLNEPDDGSSAKRPDDKPSKLREKNKMLASLLSNPAKAPTSSLPTPVVKIIPDITSSTVNRVTSSSGIGQPPPVASNQQQQQQLSGAPTGGPGNSNQQQQQQQQKSTNQSQQQHSSTNPHANQSRNIRKPSDAYLNQPMPTQQTQQDQTKNQMMLSGNQTAQASPSTSSVQRPQSTNFQMDSPFATSATTSSSSLSLSVAATSSSTQQQMASSSTGPGNNEQSQYEVDPELSKILNDVIDFVPDSYSSQEMNEKMAINAIQKSLMQFENTAFSGSPPAYSSMMGSQQQQQQLSQPNNPNNQGFHHPPPVYSSRPVRIPMPGNVSNNQALRIQYRTDRLLQQQQKERLLQQQQKQHMVVPESATARADQLCLNPGMSNIGSLLNNTVAPNVSLTRSGLPDSQLSPGFPQSLMQQQLSPGQRNAPFSPQQNQGYQTQFSNNGQRLSPQQQQQLSQVQQQQQQMAFQGGTNTSSSNQLSPRQPPFNVNAQGVSGNLVQQSQPPPPQPNQQWNAAVPVPGNNTRLSLQQHNPMLSAQLQGVSPYSAARQFQSQRRSLNSPGAPGVSRQNSFTTQDNSGFPGPPSPNTQAPYGATTTAAMFNNQSLQRMQRQTSVPQATQHLPGSPRSFGGSDGTGGYGMMYNSMQHATQGPPPNDFYGRTQTAGNGMNSSEYVRQELRAVVSGRTAQQTPGGGGGNSSGGGGGSNVNVGGGGNSGGGGGGNGLRTPQSPLGLGQGSMVGANSTNPLGMNTAAQVQQQQQQQQQPQPSPTQQQQQQQLSGTPLLNTPQDPTLNFNFDLPQTGSVIVVETNKLPTTLWSSPEETASSTTISSRPPIILEEIQLGDPNKTNQSLLLQKLLSD